MAKTKKKGSTGRVQKFNIADVIIYLILGLFAFVTLYPFIYTIAGSFSDAEDMLNGPIWFFPRKFSIASYLVILADKRLFQAFFNTLWTTVVGTLFGLLIQSCCAYAFASRRLRGKKFFWYLNMITMFVGGGMIPTYLVMVLLGLYDTHIVLFLPYLYSVYNTIIMTNFFRGIDPALYESAVMDGASEFTIWIRIYLPISKPVLATVGLWIAVARWNAYYPTMIYTAKGEDKWLLQYYLMRLIKEGDSPNVDGIYRSQVSTKTLSYAAIVVSSLPIILAYPFIAKNFSKGARLGSIKG